MRRDEWRSRVLAARGGKDLQAILSARFESPSENGPAIDDRNSEGAGDVFGTLARADPRFRARLVAVTIFYFCDGASDVTITASQTTTRGMLDVVMNLKMTEPFETILDWFQRHEQALTLPENESLGRAALGALGRTTWSGYLTLRVFWLHWWDNGPESWQPRAFIGLRRCDPCEAASRIPELIDRGDKEVRGWAPLALGLWADPAGHAGASGWPRPRTRLRRTECGASFRMAARDERRLQGSASGAAVLRMLGCTPREREPLQDLRWGTGSQASRRGRFRHRSGPGEMAGREATVQGEGSGEGLGGRASRDGDPVTALLPAPGEPDACYLVDLSNWSRPCYAVEGAGAVVRGCVGKLVTLLLEHAPAYLGFAVDLPGRTWHHDLWAGYHSKRTTPGDAYFDALNVVVQILRAHRMPVWSSPGHNADDVIATATAEARAAGLRVVIVSRDQDLWQLVDKQGSVIAWDGKSPEAIGADDVRAKYHGIGPAWLGDLLALAGDGDEAPGVPGCGVVKGAALLKRYGPTGDNPLEMVLKHGPAASGKLAANLREHADAARLGRKLVTLRKAPIVWDLEELEVGWDADDAAEIRRMGAALGNARMIGVEASPKPGRARSS